MFQFKGKWEWRWPVPKHICKCSRRALHFFWDWSLSCHGPACQLEWCGYCHPTDSGWYWCSCSRSVIKPCSFKSSNKNILSLEVGTVSFHESFNSKENEKWGGQTLILSNTTASGPGEIFAFSDTGRLDRAPSGITQEIQAPKSRRFCLFA